MKELSHQPSRFKAFRPPRAGTAIFGRRKGTPAADGGEPPVDGSAAAAAGSPLTPPDGTAVTPERVGRLSSGIGALRLGSGRARSKSRPRVGSAGSPPVAAPTPSADRDGGGGVAVTGLAATRAHVLATRPGLAPLVPARGWAPALMAITHNGLRGELLDMHVILTVCERNKMRLTHTAVDRFYEWYRLCQRFLASTVTIEEDLVIAPAEERTRGGLTGGLRLGARMKRRGRVQKLSLDVTALYEAFHPCLPAGEVLADLLALAGELTDAVLDYCTLIESLLPPRLEAAFNRLEGRKLTGRVVKCHRRVSDDHIILMTRWMTAKAQVEFVATILMPSDFVCFSYHQWAKQVDKKHCALARTFEEELKAELDDDDEVRRAHAAANLQRLAQRANENGGGGGRADSQATRDGGGGDGGGGGRLSGIHSSDDPDAVVAGGSDDLGLGAAAGSAEAAVPGAEGAGGGSVAPRDVPASGVAV